MTLFRDQKEVLLTEIYNPWSVTNYFASGGQAKPYWANTSDNEIIREILTGLTPEIADDLAKEGYPAFIGPTMGGKSKYELLNKTFKTPAVLNSVGVDIAIITDAGVIQIEYLPLVAGMAAKAGLPFEEAWKAITINAATLTGIGDRVGSLEVGKDGDVVIWQADPLREVGAEAHITVIDGKVVYRATEE